MTTKTLEWLNQNRFRAYPFINDKGLLTPQGSRIPDCVVLDCLVSTDQEPTTPLNFKFTNIKITEEETTISFKLGTVTQLEAVTLTGGSATGAGSIETCIFNVVGSDNIRYHIKLVFSSHAHIIEQVGEGEWNFNGTILPTRILSTMASGVAKVQLNGSINVTGFESPAQLKGDIELVDGYRTQPTIKNNKIVINVGTNYGENPCNYPYDPKITPCDHMLLFFCGQTANQSGSIAITGGPGISVNPGEYTVTQDIKDSYGKISASAGEKIPCIEIRASPELLKIYTPTSISDLENS